MFNGNNPKEMIQRINRVKRNRILNEILQYFGYFLLAGILLTMLYLIMPKIFYVTVGVVLAFIAIFHIVKYRKFLLKAIKAIPAIIYIFFICVLVGLFFAFIFHNIIFTIIGGILLIFLPFKK